MNHTIQALTELYPDILKLSSKEIKNAIKQSKNENERDFYMTLEGFLIGIEQKKVIKSGRY